jgi:hypothetical protein
VSEHRLVQVTWLDADCDHEETVPADWKDDQPVTTVGFVVRDTKRMLSVAAEILEGDPVHGDKVRYRCVTHLPRGYIVRVVELREAASPDLDRPVQP